MVLVVANDSHRVPAVTVHCGERSHKILLASGEKLLTHTALLYEVRSVFSLWSGHRLLLSLAAPPQKQIISASDDLMDLAGKSLYVVT